MRMAENRWAPGADVIDVFVAIDVPHARAFGFVDEKRLAAHGAERAHGRIHAAGDAIEGLREKFFGLNVRHHIDQTFFNSASFRSFRFFNSANSSSNI